MTKSYQRSGFRKPRDVRELSHATMSDDDLTRAIRLNALRKAIEGIMTRPLTNDEWRTLMRKLYLDGKSRTEKPAARNE